MTDIVELLENLSVSPHQQSIIDSAVDEIVGLREGLQTIANNSCCGTCQEAALVAKRTLEGKDG